MSDSTNNISNSSITSSPTSLSSSLSSLSNVKLYNNNIKTYEPDKLTNEQLEIVNKWRKRQRLSLLRFVTYHYLIEYFILLSFPLLRYYLLPLFYPSIIDWNELDSQGKDVKFASLAAILALMKYNRVSTIDAWVSHFFRYMKLGMLAAAYVVDWRFCLFYGIIFLFQAAFMPQPSSTAQSNVKARTHREFMTTIHGSMTTDYYVVFLHVPWSDNSNLFLHEFILLSLKYGYKGSNVHFYMFDVSNKRSVSIAKLLDVDTSTLSEEVPAVFLYHKGEKLIRLPDIGKKVKLNAQIVGATFNLDDITKVPEYILEENNPGSDVKKKSKDKKKH